MRPFQGGTGLWTAGCRLARRPHQNRSTIGGGGRGCHKFVPVLERDGTKIAPSGDLFDHPPGEISSVRGKITDLVGDHVVLSPEGDVLVTTSPGTESSYPRPPQSLKHSPTQGLHHHGPRYFNFPYFCTMCGLEKLGLVDQN